MQLLAFTTRAALRPSVYGSYMVSSSVLLGYGDLGCLEGGLKASSAVIHEVSVGALLQFVLPSLTTVPEAAPYTHQLLDGRREVICQLECDAVEQDHRRA